MLIPVHTASTGPGPSEVLIEIQTKDGIEEVVVSNSQLRDQALEIGSPVGRENGHSLIELPMESASGKWRVWVKTESLKAAEAVAV
jgi:hypothetical protein